MVVATTYNSAIFVWACYCNYKIQCKHTLPNREPQSSVTCLTCHQIATWWEALISIRIDRLLSDSLFVTAFLRAHPHIDRLLPNSTSTLHSLYDLHTVQLASKFTARISKNAYLARFFARHVRSLAFDARVSKSLAQETMLASYAARDL